MTDLRVEILATGDELLTGQLVDTNSVWLMDRLWELGLMAGRKTLVGDDRTELQAAVRETTARADVVVMSGGMGPTEDDLTGETVAALLGVPLELHEPSLAAIQERFRRFGRTMTPNNEKQARFPRGAEEWLLPRIAARLGQVPAAGMVKLFGVPESHADHLMRPIMDDPASAGVRFGYRAHWPEVHVKWTVPEPDAAARAERIRTRVREVFGEQVFGEGKDELPELVVGRLAARGERVALAESCTGGLVAQLLTEVPGASVVLDVGVVAYANGIKERVLGVEGGLLAAHGAVSEPVARAMAEGARRLGSATWGIGVTGIAGPTGGTPEKPVGTVHLALAGPSGTEAVQRLYRGDRPRIRRQAAFEALNMLRLAMR